MAKSIKSKIVEEQIENYLLAVIDKRGMAKIIPRNIAKKNEDLGWTLHYIEKVLVKLENEHKIISMPLPEEAPMKGFICRLNEIKRSK